MPESTIHFEALLVQMDAGLGVLARIEHHLEDFLAHEGQAMGRNNVAAVVVADALRGIIPPAKRSFSGLPGFMESLHV
jgi:hypothetical protein